jgi:hypothetical protein
LTAPPAPRIWTLVVAVLVLGFGLFALEVWILQGYLVLSSPQLMAGGELPSMRTMDSFYATLPGILLEATFSGSWLGAVALIAAAFSATPLVPRLGLVPARIGRAAWVLVPLGGLAVSQAVDHAFTLWGGRGGTLDTLLEALASARGLSLVVTVLVVGVLSATCEELFFRGYLQRRLVERFGPALGITLPALLFGIAHFDLHHGTFAFLFGAFVGWAAWRAGSTWIAIAAHVANNTLSVLALAAGLDDAKAPAAVQAIVLGASVVIVVLVVRWFRGSTAAGETAGATARA